MVKLRSKYFNTAAAIVAAIAVAAALNAVEGAAVEDVNGEISDADIQQFMDFMADYYPPQHHEVRKKSYQPEYSSSNRDQRALNYLYQMKKRYFINSDKLEDERREERRRRRQLRQRRRRQAGLAGDSSYSWWDRRKSFVDENDSKPKPSASSSSYGVEDRVNSGLRKTFGGGDTSDQDNEDEEELQPLSRGEKKKYVRLLSAFRRARFCLRRDMTCPNLKNGKDFCCDGSQCSCNLFNQNCKCSTIGLFQRFG